MAYPGRKTRIALRISKSSVLIMLTVLSLISGIPLNLAANASVSSTSASNSPLGSKSISGVGANPVPDLSLPKPILSGINRLLGAGGIIQTSSDNVTLYNLGIAFRLLGGRTPHDELLGRDHKVLSSWSFWSIEAQIANTDSWTPLSPTSSSFQILGTNETGSFVTRTMLVSAGQYSGTLQVGYRALASGPLKWNLKFTAQTAGTYRLAYTWRDLKTILHPPDHARHFSVGYGLQDFNFSWNDVPPALNSTAELHPSFFTLRINVGTLAAGSATSIDPQTVGRAPNGASYSFQRNVFYDPKGGYYFVFYYNGFFPVYSSSNDGTNWSTYSMPADGQPTTMLPHPLLLLSTPVKQS